MSLCANLVFRQGTASAVPQGTSGRTPSFRAKRPGFFLRPLFGRRVAQGEISLRLFPQPIQPCRKWREITEALAAEGIAFQLPHRLAHLVVTGINVSAPERLEEERLNASDRSNGFAMEIHMHSDQILRSS